MQHHCSDCLYFIWTMGNVAAIPWLLQLWLCMTFLSMKCLAQLPESELRERCETNIRIVGAIDSSAPLSCQTVKGGVVSIRWSFLNSTVSKNISIDGSKYTDEMNSLQINRVVGSDEGLYVCHFQQEIGGQLQPEQSIDAGCIYVLGRAQYLTCEPSDYCICQEHVNVHSRLPILFDTRITYTDGGSLEFIQDTLRLQLYRGTRATGDLLYSCQGNKCESSENIAILSGSSNRTYDIQLRAANTERDDSGIYTAYVDVINPATGGQTSLVKTFVVNEEWPLAIHFIRDTPAVCGDAVMIQFVLSRPADNVRCRIVRNSQKLFRDCSSGSITFSDLQPGNYIFRVVADNGRLDRAIERRMFEITSDPSVCTVHLINDGVTVNGTRVTVEYAGTGNVQGFSCRLRGQEAFSCIRPVELSDLNAGEHHLRISPKGCAVNKELVVRFTTEI